MQEDDDYEFWDDDGWTTRVHTHHHVEPYRKNPLWARLGALVAVGLLAVLVAVMMRSSDDSQTLEGQATADVEGADVASSEAATAPAVTTLEPLTPQTTAAPTSPPAVVEVAPAAPVQDTVPQLQAEALVETVQSETPTTPKPAVTSPAATAAATKKRSCAMSYKPVEGDYWILVARKANVRLSELLAANDATTDTPIYPGFTVCLPANASQPVAAVETPATTAKATSTTAKPTSTTAKPTSTTAKPTSTAAKPTSTTAAPTTTAAPPPTISYSRDQVTQIIRDIWPDELEDEAIRIATRESNLIPTAKNWCCYGLFQIYFGANQSSLKGWGITSATMLFDPNVNAYAAYAMYLRAGGWGPWQ